MRLGVAAGLLALAAVAVHLGLTTRYRAEASASADEFRQVRDERRRVAGQLARSVRLQDAQRRAGRLPAQGEGGPLTPARAARLQVVRSLEGSGIEHVRLGVVPALVRPQAVNVRLKGEGSFEDVVRFAGHVARPGSGFLLQEAVSRARPAVSAPLRQAVLAVTSVLALAVVCAVAWTPRPRAEAPPSPAPRAVTPPPASTPAADPRDVMPERNVFEYGERVSVAPPAPTLAPLVVPPPLAPAVSEPAPAEPIRLVGFVKRGGGVRAALSMDGSVSVLSVGQEAGGYSVLSVDEDAGVTVRTPDGAELLLPPPRP